MIRFFSGILFFLFSTYMVYAQNVSVLKDSVCISKECFELQELKINSPNTRIYKKIQKDYDIFNGFLFDIPEKRLQAKKDTLRKLISENSLKESQFGFEKYRILFDRNGLLNLSVRIKSYGSPWEDIRYSLFDINDHTDIGDKLFINKNLLLKLCNKKLYDQDLVNFKVDSLSEYILNTDNKKNFTGITFIMYNTEERESGGYKMYSVPFTRREIEKFITPKYKETLLKH
ncbi:hypothetical protein MKJ01_13850 [Chryseobacterium sp. SSA4.19]|uniref:hypothetical protein n=1 Tax=Chryseobacterium sp. SSA4.19 TaxID=2919915 RepID=UPI001F4E7420|nr:hypothetical protein [Chryseobacterium sp. SSA4.19]MCJ8154851.1 hypothetical protein [Chryseobacterium sp. SSA4.19]